MRGIILAGGTGSRLWPITKVTNKHLLLVYDKPLIYYPLSTLMQAGIRDILIISTSEAVSSFKQLLGNGENFGVRLTYEIQNSPNGIAEAFIIGEDFIQNDSFALILGDNIFHGVGLGRQIQTFIEAGGARIFGYRVSNPGDFGVVVIDENDQPLKIIEKPSEFVSDIAVPGLYCYDSEVIFKAKTLLPSSRNELEITDLNNLYLNELRLELTLLSRGTVWMDAGTIDSLNDASNYVRIVEQKQGLKIGCPEEIAWRNGWITTGELREIANESRSESYSMYLLNLLDI